MTGPVVLLILTVITAGQHPDIVRRIDEPSIEKCWEDAAAFLAQGLPKGQHDAEGLAAIMYFTNHTGSDRMAF